MVNTETVVIVEGRFSFHSWEAKVPYFFSRKSLHLTHSLDFCKTVFFSTCREKKHLIFFRGKFWKPLTQQKQWDLQKKVKQRSKNINFCTFYFLWFLFFFLERFTPHSLTYFQRARKKIRLEKKTQFSRTNSILAQKSKK